MENIMDRVTALEKLLEDKIRSYDLEIARARAAIDIQNIMGRYALYYTAQKYDQCAKLWARREDSSCDLMFGVFEGYEGVCRCYNEEHPEPVGLLRVHTFTSGAVEVAEDGLTAAGTWISPGVDTSVGEDGKPNCHWCWIKYKADFIKEDGVWYLWHLWCYGLFHTDYYTSWGDQEPRPLRRAPDIMLAPGQTDESVFAARLSDRDDWTYSKDRRPVLEPAPPLPYSTWAELQQEE